MTLALLENNDSSKRKLKAAGVGILPYLCLNFVIYKVGMTIVP